MIAEKSVRKLISANLKKKINSREKSLTVVAVELNSISLSGRLKVVTPFHFRHAGKALCLLVGIIADTGGGANPATYPMFQTGINP